MIPLRRSKGISSQASSTWYCQFFLILILGTSDGAGKKKHHSWWSLSSLQCIRPSVHSPSRLSSPRSPSCFWNVRGKRSTQRKAAGRTCKPWNCRPAPRGGLANRSTAAPPVIICFGKVRNPYWVMRQEERRISSRKMIAALTVQWLWTQIKQTKPT